MGEHRRPFAGEAPDPTKSLPWWFYNKGKRGLTLDLDRADGQAVLRRLVATADVLVECVPLPSSWLRTADSIRRSSPPGSSPSSYTRCRCTAS